LSISGNLPLRGQAQKTRDRPWKLSLTCQPENLVLQGAGLKAQAWGRINLSGSLPDAFALSGEIKAKGSFGSGTLNVKEFSLLAPLAGTLNSPSSPAWILKAPPHSLSYGKLTLPLGEVKARGKLVSQPGGFTLEGLVLGLGGLGTLHGGARQHQGAIKGELEGKDLPAEKVKNLAEVFSPGLQGWKCGGPLDLKINLQGRPENPDTLTIRLGLALKGLNFTSPQEDTMAQDLRGSLLTEATGASNPACHASLSFNQGEMLWKTIYLNLKEAPLKMSGSGVIIKGPGIKNLSLDCSLGGHGRLHARGNLQKSRGRIHYQGQVKMGSASLAKIFSTFISEPLASQSPDLGKLRVRGRGRADLKVKGVDQQVAISGRININQGSLGEDASAPWLEGVNLNLPLAYEWGPPAPTRRRPTGAKEWGSLSLAGIKLPYLQMGPTQLPVALVPNRLLIGKGLDLPLFKGSLRLSNIEIEEPLSEEFKATLSAEIEDWDLAALPSGQIKLRGRLGGLLAPVTLTRHSLTAPGSLTGELFGGRLLVENVSIVNPLLRGRELGADLKAKRINMEPLSAALGAGRVTGLVDIDLEGLRIAYGQPVAFNLRVKSVEDAGAEQQVSLQAVNSISVLGTGSGLTGLGLSLFKSFFKEFPYQKIGMACTLQNDVFTVRGLIHEDGVEYLVKKPPLLGINVINRTEDNRISWSDMLDRLRRVTTSQPEPDASERSGKKENP
jgi:hypothetical protein